ncbi:MAG: hypothetical protein KDK34_01570 [Leptospiraceae bacterium]|nr:hypothetical protein [Leptospiraceae bacterium]
MTNQSTAGVILGTAFHSAGTGPMVETDVSGRSIEITFESEEIVTEFGPQVVHHISGLGRPAVAIFRHGIPHALLPNQINYRAQAAALKRLDVRSLLITSSVGVLDPNVPLFQPLLPGDLLMPDNRLPDGSACSMFVDSNPDQGHLVIEEGLFSRTLTDVLYDCCLHNGAQPMRDLVFAYVGGPRTKTLAENRMWAQPGAAIKYSNARNREIEMRTKPIDPYSGIFFPAAR